MRGRQLVYLHVDQRNFKVIETSDFFPMSDLQRKIFMGERKKGLSLYWLLGFLYFKKMSHKLK